MTSKKIHQILFIIVFFITKVNAQFVGYYKLDDAEIAIDAPHPSLFILPNKEFYFFKYGSYITGKWNEVDKNSIQLTESKTDTIPINVYGKFNESSEEITVNLFSYLGGVLKSYSFINFSKDTSSPKKFQPIFNDASKWMPVNYEIKNKMGDYNWLTINIPTDKNTTGDRINYPCNTTSYKFPLDKKYNYFTVVKNIEALLEPRSYKLRKENETYYIGFDRFLKQKELTTEEALKKIENAKIAIEKESYKKMFGTKMPCELQENSIIYKSSILKDYLIDESEDEEIENDYDTKIKKRTATFVDRNNGFYTVLNYNEKDYDSNNYELAKEPSIKKDDILAVTKITSNYGGKEIEIVFTEKGKLKFAEVTRQNIGKPIVLVVNKLVVFAPIIYSEIPGGKANVRGSFSETEIDEIIANLKK